MFNKKNSMDMTFSDETLSKVRVSALIRVYFAKKSRYFTQRAVDMAVSRFVEKMGAGIKFSRLETECLGEAAGECRVFTAHINTVAGAFDFNKGLNFYNYISDADEDDGGWIWFDDREAGFDDSMYGFLHFKDAIREYFFVAAGGEERWEKSKKKWMNSHWGGYVRGNSSFRRLGIGVECLWLKVSNITNCKDFE